MKTFEDYLKKVCFDINPTVLDDDMSDFFDDWLGNLDGEEYIKWGDFYGREMFLKGEEKILKTYLSGK